jgi:hypothetical protein
MRDIYRQSLGYRFAHPGYPCWNSIRAQVGFQSRPERGRARTISALIHYSTFMLYRLTKAPDEAQWE